MSVEMRYCPDIALWAFDRPINDIIDAAIKGSCVWMSEYCKHTCYNLKLYKLYPAMRTKDIRNERSWQAITGAAVYAFLSRKRKVVKRARFMTRGEAISTYADLTRVKDICESTPEVMWWLPTRAWRDPVLRACIEADLMHIPNLAIHASTDPSTSVEEQAMLDAHGWSTMFYGDDSQLETLTGHKRFKCPKTHGKVKGACSVCVNGCFKRITKGETVHVHLSQH